MLDACGIRTLPPEFFEGVTSLAKLWLSNNGIRALPGPSLPHLANLNSL